MEAASIRADGAVRVLLAIRHEAERAGVRAALLEHGFRVAAECRSAADAVAAARKCRPEICLLDLDLPGEVLAAVAAIARQATTRVVVLAEAATANDALAAFDAGAAGFLLKSVTSERLAAGLQDVAQRHVTLSPELLTDLVEVFRGGGGGRLTGRERQVLTLLKMGLTTKQVAQRIGISATTVRRHVSSAVHKLGAASRRAAIDEGVQDGERQ